MPFVTVKQARKLTGLSDHIIRKWLREIILFGSERDKVCVRKEKGKWQMDLALVDKLAERDRPTEQKEKDEPTKEHFGLPRLDHPLIGLLQRQLINKDQQMDRLHNHIDNLLERNRELNVMLHKLQQQLASEVDTNGSDPMKGASRSGEGNQGQEASPKTPESLSATVSPGSQLKDFSQWLRSVAGNRE